MLMCYRIILLMLVLLGSHCHKTISIEELSKNHKFLANKDDNGATALDKASKLSGLWQGRLAYVKSKDIYLATIQFTLKSDANDNLFFDDFTFHKIVMPQVNEAGFNRKKTASDSKIILANTQKIVIPSFKKDENELKKIHTTESNLLDFTIDFSKEPLFKSMMHYTIKGLIWVSRDLNTMIGSGGSILDNLYFIAQRGVNLSDSSLTQSIGQWESISFIYNKTSDSLAIAGTSEVNVTADSDIEAKLKGIDSQGNAFSGSIFMPDKTMGSSMIELNEQGTISQGGFLLSPDHKYVYGIFFNNGVEFIGIKK